VGEDWQQGRLYLPLDELARFNLSEADINKGVVDDRWRSFMRFQIQRARKIYADAIPGIRMLQRDGRFSIAAAAILYQSILDEIEQNDYDVFYQRAYVSTWGKIRRLPEILALST
jgi:phytoene synthase